MKGTIADSISGMAVAVERPASSMHDACVRTLLIEAVRLWVRQVQREGGPDPRRSETLAEQLGAEPLSGKPMKTAQQFNLLAESLAHLSFVPGGCRAFGLRFEAAPLLAERAEHDEHPSHRGSTQEQQSWQARGETLQEAARTGLSDPTKKREEQPKEQRKQTPVRQMPLFSTEEKL
ncbi:MAG TPA: hypothetical protein VNG51_01285 [Ktedonobacteraceae bacterium]|nr:hypothetical protein [Ktedonobacteraceae bacterium]